MPDNAPKSGETASPYEAPHIQSGFMPGDEPQFTDHAAPPPLTGEGRGRDNRGHRAAITEAGEVIGSGAGAGGKGGPEDFDADPQAGGGTFELGHPDRPNHGGDASQHNST